MTQQQPKSSFGRMDILLLFLVLVWGANFAVVKSAISEIPPLAFNALRFSGGSALTLALAWGVQRDLRIPRRDWGVVAGVSLLGGFVYQMLFIEGQVRTRAGNASLILSMVPIFVALIGTILHSERLTARNWAGVLVSFSGIVLLVAGSTSTIGVGRDTLLGDLLVLACTVTWSLYTVLARPLTQRYSSLGLTAWMMTLSTPLLVLVGLPELRSTRWQAISTQAWIGLAYSAILAIAVGYVIWNQGVKELGGSRTAAYKYLTPIVTLVASWLLLGETLRPVQAIGALGILLGVALARSKR